MSSRFLGQLFFPDSFNIFLLWKYPLEKYENVCHISHILNFLPYVNINPFLNFWMHLSNVKKILLRFQYVFWFLPVTHEMLSVFSLLLLLYNYYDYHYSLCCGRLHSACFIPNFYHQFKYIMSEGNAHWKHSATKHFPFLPNLTERRSQFYFSLDLLFRCSENIIIHITNIYTHTHKKKVNIKIDK